MSQQVTNIRDSEEVCSTMDSSLAIAGSAAATGVTTFSNEACEGVAIGTYKPSALTNMQSDLQDLKAYFERPRLIARGSVAFGTITNMLVDTVTLSSFQSYFPQWSNRLSGVFAIRFTLNYRLQVAATAFHQGLLALAFQYESNSSSLSQFCRANKTMACTNIPHARLDLSETTMIELSIPFLWHGEYYPVSGTNLSGTAIYGTMGLNSVLPPISVTGLVAPTYELYTYLTDIELYGADNNTSTTITLQSGGTAIQAKETTHLMSDSLSQVAKIGRFVAGKIPMMSSVAGTTAWAADIAAGVARYFGYSRPLLQDPVVRVNRVPYAGESNVDVPMAGFNVGLMQSNTLCPDPDFGATDVDEMAFDFIKAQYSQICTGSITTSNTHATVIYATPISPLVLWYRRPASAPYCQAIAPASSANLISQSGNSFLPSSLMALASNFRLWRGGIKFRFTFAKTKFHGGRYMVSYNPNTTLNSIPINYTTIEGPEAVGGLVQPYGYSMIMDLRDGNVFEFSVPYLAESPYVSYESSTGGLSMVCIDPLQASSSVSSTVQFLVEVCGEPDFEVADYAGPYYVPLPIGTIYLQSGGVATATKEPSQTTIGERLTSVKQVIQSPWWQNYSAAASSTNAITLAPWFINYTFAQLYAGIGLPMANTIAAQGASSPGGFWARFYVFARGGSDVHAYCTNSGSRMILQQRAQGYKTNEPIAKAYVSRPLVGCTPKVVSHGDAPIHARLPAYSTYVRTPVNAYDELGFTVTGAATNQNMPWRAHTDILTLVAPTATEFWLARAAADDAALAHYIGPPPMYIPNSTNNNFIDNGWA